MQKEMPPHAITVDELLAQLQGLRKSYGGQLEVLEGGDSNTLVNSVNVVTRGGKRYASVNSGDAPHGVIKVGCWAIKEIDTGHGATCTDDEFKYAFELVENPCSSKDQVADKIDSTKTERRFGYKLCEKHSQEYLGYCCLCAVGL